MSTYSAGGGNVLGIVRYGRDEMTRHEHEMQSSSADIEPGMLIERTMESGNVVVQPNTTTVDTDASAYVAIEARGRGMNANLSDSDPYQTDGDNLVIYVKPSGGGLYMLLAAGTDLGDSAEANITGGDKLVSAGGADAGTLKQYDSANDDADAILFEAEESVDNSGASTGQTAFIKVTPA